MRGIFDLILCFEFFQSFTADDLFYTDPWNAVVRMKRDYKYMTPFRMATLKPPDKPANYEAKIQLIKEHSRKQYGRPAAEIDAELASRYSEPQPTEPETKTKKVDDRTLPPSPPVEDEPLTDQPTTEDGTGDIDLEDIWE